MSELQTMLGDMVDRLLKELSEQRRNNQSATLNREQWQLIEEFGLTRLLLPESKDGFNGQWSDAYLVFELLGKYTLPLPIGETIIAKNILHQLAPENGSDLDHGMITIGQCEEPNLSSDKEGNWVFSGALNDTPWGEEAGSILLQISMPAGNTLLLLDPASAATMETISAGNTDPRTQLNFDHAKPLLQVNTPSQQHSVFHAAALLRSAQISGAMQATLALSVQYVNERSQFGRALAKFQVIQHDLARMAEQVSAVKAAAVSACKARDYDPASFEIGSAKLRANMAVPMVCSIAHQVHGAIGFTQEYPLHCYTRRLRAWRSEFGNDGFWSQTLGEQVLQLKETSLWQFLTERSDSILQQADQLDAVDS